MTTYRKTILTSDSGTGSVNLNGVAPSRVGNVQVAEGVGEATLEAMGTLACRIMVTGGVLDGEVVVTWDEAD